MPALPRRIAHAPLRQTKENIERVWSRAFAARRPVAVSAYVDPDLPPLPPHIDLEQARNFMASMLKDDAEKGGELVQSVKAMAAKITRKLRRS